MGAEVVGSAPPHAFLALTWCYQGLKPACSLASQLRITSWPVVASLWFPAVVPFQTAGG